LYLANQNCSKPCQNSQNIIDHWPKERERDPARLRFPHNQDDIALACSSAKGCGLCTQLLRGFVTVTKRHGLHFVGDNKILPSSSWAKIMSLRLGGFWTIQLHVPFTGDPTRYRSDGDIDDDAKSYPFYSRYLVDVAPASLRGKHLHSSPKGVLILTEVGAVPEHKDHLMNTRDGLPLLKHWYEACCETHIECNHDSETKKFPMRLIDVMKDPPTLCV
jgi:hypothetical protein